MERIAIISDIHGNITALNAVFEDIEKRGIKTIYSIGDYVTKCVHPDLVIDAIRQKCEVSLLGNCDYSIAKSLAKERKYWSRIIIGEERAEWLFGLPKSFDFYMSGHLIRLFHASPHSLDGIYNPMFINDNPEKKIHTNPEELFENTSFIGKSHKDPIPDIVGYGHLHTPFVIRYKNKTIFNTGSVGIPVEMDNNDENDPNNKFSTMASYTIIEGERDSKELANISFQQVRIRYDIEKEIKDLENSDMPTRNQVIYNLKTAISTN